MRPLVEANKAFRRCWEETEMPGLCQAPPDPPHTCVHTLLLALGLPRQLDPLGPFSLGQWPVPPGIQELLLPASPESAALNVRDILGP